MSSFDNPQSRNEAILQNMLGAENTLGAPQSRIESLLMQILEDGAQYGRLKSEYDDDTNTVTLSVGGNEDE